ncbi:MAG TPA: methyl-accepting chemotaxis protein [Burkholderiales bacterium]|nr:methyl-accepting chemotaxis protein [Burkholderiales bacterium]
MNKFFQMPIGRQVFIVTLALCSLVFAVLIMAVSSKMEQTSSEVAERDLKAQLKVVTNLMEYAYRQGIGRAQRNADQFIQFLPGKVTIDDKLVPTGAAELPALKVGKEAMNGNTRLLDEFRDRTGVEAAFLMRYKGELYRVVSLLKTPDGKSTFGTIIPKGDAQERAYASGVPTSTMVERDGRYFSSHLIPLKDDKGNMIAAVTIRVNLTKDMADFKKILAGVKIAHTGYLYAFRPKNDEDAGVFTVHPKFEGKTIKDAFGPTPVYAAIKEISKTKNGVLHFDMPDAADGGKLKDRLSVFMEIPSWGWVVGGGAFMDEFLEDSRALRNQLIVESVIAALLLIGLIYGLLMLSLKRLKPVMQAMQRQGAGDLTARIEDVAEKSRNELDVLARCFNQSGASVQTMMSNVAVAVQRIGGSSDELERAAGEIARSTSQQSEAAASMAASVEQLTVSITHVADSAGEASASTVAAKQASDEGSKVIGHSIGEMQRIAEGINGSAQQINELGARSREISGIIKVIGEIAGQTNLLALNAAIEAARAGEQGRGFAVVADEVRKLSERTGASAQEISKMIGAIQAETESAVERMNAVAKEMTGGVELVQNVGVSLGKIDAKTRDTTALAGQIATAVNEQKVASEDIARRLESIAQAAEENSALTGNNRDVALNLRQCASELQGQIEKFKI